jgi:hypothetical protein
MTVNSLAAAAATTTTTITTTTTHSNITANFEGNHYRSTNFVYVIFAKHNLKDMHTTRFLILGIRTTAAATNFQGITNIVTLYINTIFCLG